MDGTSRSDISLEQKMAVGSDEAARLRQQLQQAQRALKRSRQHLQLQETRSRQLVTACAAKLRERQAEAERADALKELQFQRILQQLTVLQSKLKREQKAVLARLGDQEQLTQQKAREVERLKRTNRRLLGKVHRLSQPCARCGARPDSGISDCDDGDEVAAKASRLELPEPAAERSDGSPEPGAERRAEHRPERGIIRTPGEPRPAPHKTVTFSLQDKENAPAAAERRRRPLQPRITPPPSANVNGTTYGQPSIVDTISQLLGADLEWPVVRRPSLVPKKLSVIPEGNESSRDELSEPEYENVRVETPGQADKDESGAGKGGGKTEEALDNDSVQSRNYRNVPRSRSNINLIMSESEGVQIKDNFEEFKFDDDMASSVCSDSPSDRSADGGGGENHSCDRRAGDGAESEQAAVKNVNGAINGVTHGVPNGVKHGMHNGISNGLINGLANGLINGVTNGNYEKFLELSGLSQKALNSQGGILISHRLAQRQKDGSHRHRVRMVLDGPANEAVSPTSVRYYSEQL